MWNSTQTVYWFGFVLLPSIFLQSQLLLSCLLQELLLCMVVRESQVLLSCLLQELLCMVVSGSSLKNTVLLLKEVFSPHLLCLYVCCVVIFSNLARTWATWVSVLLTLDTSSSGRVDSKFCRSVPVQQVFNCDNSDIFIYYPFQTKPLVNTKILFCYRKA